MLTNIKITDMNKYIKKALDKISNISKPKEKDNGWGSAYKNTHWGMRNK
jgi:hypothetical protein